MTSTRAHIRTYTELISLATIEDRYRYLALSGKVANQTFGFDRWVNQKFYRSREWQSVRHAVIVRDSGRDLGVEGYEVPTRITIHHMNPMTADQISQGLSEILDPEYLISVSHSTHNAIHYGDESQLPRLPVDRRPGDTKLW